MEKKICSKCKIEKDICEFYKNPKKILGKIITVQYFEETKNQDGGISLRFPTFKILHGSARTV